jgi:hypothetical protein
MWTGSFENASRGTGHRNRINSGIGNGNGCPVVERDGIADIRIEDNKRDDAGL